MITILIVDDETVILQLIKYTLEANGYDVIGASNGQEGMELFEAYANEIALIICDLEMPVSNGYDFIAKVREHHPLTKIIVSSGYVSTEKEKGLIQYGVQMLRKPYSIAELLTAIEDAVGPVKQGMKT